jgi:outer membrane protein insertion porin family
MLSKNYFEEQPKRKEKQMNNRILSLGLILILITSCTANKYLPDDKKYYDGAQVVWHAEGEVSPSSKKNTINDMQAVLRPEPNVKLLGMRPQVWFYHIAGEVEKEKGFKYWLKYKLGSEPVYLEDVNITQMDRLLQNRLELNGFFDGIVTPNVKERKHNGIINYDTYVTSPYKYDTIAPIEGEGILVDSIRAIQNNEEETLIATGERYDFDNLELERARIEQALKNEGFYFFDGRFILFRADSTVNPDGKGVAIFPKLKDNVTDQARTPYTIDSVTIHSDFLIQPEDTVFYNGTDTIRVQDLLYTTRRNFFRPEIIADQVLIRPGQRYSRDLELRTINRLIQLDVFRLVNVEYTELDSGRLNTNIYLSPYKKKSVRFELSAVTTSQSFAGPHLQATFRNRNFLRGAERYELSLTGSYEWQIGGKQSTSEERTSDQNVSLLNNFEVGLIQSLVIPRLLTPFNIDYSSAKYIPETRFDLSFKFLRRVGYYQFNSAETNYGFQWRETTTKRHNLFPLSVTYIKLVNTTEEFEDILDENEVLRRSLENQFIVGTNYSFYYSSQEDPELAERDDNFYFNGNLGIAGNVLYLAHELVGGPKDEETGSYTFLNQPFSQYVRVSLDFRHYHDFTNTSRLASRFISGVGYSYGNSEVMPYAKQFSVGGASSLRGFRARSIGPGTYPGDTAVSFVDQTGEIHLELNTEWRFQIFEQIKGAIFFDIGNIWTVREELDEENNPIRPGSKFEFDSFLSELAMNTGFGIRYDIDLFVIRLDLGIPLKVPYSGTVDRAPVLNIAIGYPF